MAHMMNMSKPDWKQRAEMALNAAVSSQHFVTYAELVEAARIPSPHRVHKLTEWLEMLIEVDHGATRPIRAAWVISRNRNQLPAPGFFIKCREIGLYDGPHNGSMAKEFHQSLLA